MEETLMNISTTNGSENIDTLQMADMSLGGMIFLGVLLGIVLMCIVSAAFIFEKAGKKWYEALISGHNSVVLLQIAGKPMWWVFFMILPMVISPIGGMMHPILSIVFLLLSLVFLFSIHALVMKGISERFGKQIGFTVGLILCPIVFLPILAFGKAEYRALS